MAQSVTQGDVIAAMQELRGEVLGLVQTALFTLQWDISYSLRSLNDQAVVEIRTLAETVEGQQVALSQIMETAVTSKLAQANGSFTEEQARVNLLVEQLRTSIATVSGGKVGEVLRLLKKHEEDDLASYAA